MKNPLEQFFPAETRNDGVYIKVERAVKESLQADVVIRAVNTSTVMNFDREKFREIFSRARGVFEKIGPPFEYYDENIEKYVNISIAPLKASIKIAEDYILNGKKPSIAQLLFLLNRKGVVHGIDNGMLNRIAVESMYGRYIDVAFATPPENGSDARMELKIALSPDIKPKLRGDGSVDYRSIQTFTSVSKGDLLAVKYPPEPGKPGTTVTGEPIASQPGKDINLPAGRNTDLSSDGTQLFASTTGIVFFENSVLTVAELLHVNKDVDFSVGNIKYTGDVMVSGNVRPGFTIEAEGSIHIKGEVESATITSRAGQVTIDRGVVGKGDTIISAKQGVTISFAQDAHLHTEGVLFFEKYLLHCKASCGSIEARGTPGSIVGGEARAEKSIVVKQCGSDKGVATKVSIFDKNKTIVSEKIKELAQLHERLTGELAPIERQLKTKAKLMKLAGEDLTDRNREEVKKWVDAYNEMKKKISYVEGKIKELKVTLNNPGNLDGVIQVLDQCFPGTTISLYDVSMPINSICINKRFLFKNQLVTIEGQSHHGQEK